MQLQKLQKEDYQNMLSILTKSFPRNELRSRRQQLEVLNDPHYQTYCIKDNNDFLAFVSIFDFDDFIYLEFFAVDEKSQGLGLGSKILTQLKAMNKPIVLEVELPETNQAIRRIKFYKRNEFHLNDYPYAMPSFSEGQPPLPLKIMSYPDNLDEERFQFVKTTLYKKVYHVL